MIHIQPILKKLALVTIQYNHSDGENSRCFLHMNHHNVSHTKYMAEKLIIFNHKHNLQTPEHILVNTHENEKRNQIQLLNVLGGKNHPQSK